MSLGLIVVAAGSSRRMSGEDKVWADLGKRPVIWHSVNELATLADRTVLVVRAERFEEAQALFRDADFGLTIVVGGQERQQSVVRGLEALGAVDLIAVHDAARPLVSRQLLHSGMEVIHDCDGAIPAESLHDTVKMVDSNDRVTSTLDRSRLRAVQTPQIFRSEILRAVHRATSLPVRVVTDDAGLVEAAGHRVKVFPGAPCNFKITTPYDLELARLLVESGRCP